MLNMNTMKIFIEVLDLNLFWEKMFSSFEPENYVCGKQNRTAEKKMYVCDAASMVDTDQNLYL